jgi:cytoskeletal protein CcmA (bactofilin family)
MWRNKKSDTPRSANAEPKSPETNQSEMTAGPGTAQLGQSLHVTGEISGDEDLLIDGSVEGLVQLHERKLTVGPTARVTADIIAGEVVVCGNVKGNVRAKDRIEIKKGGSVIGDLTTPQIMIEDGAYFKGSIEIDGNPDKEADKEVSPRTRPAAKAAGAWSKSN